MSDDRAGAEQSMEDILASIRRIISEDVTPQPSSASDLDAGEGQSADFAPSKAPDAVTARLEAAPVPSGDPTASSAKSTGSDDLSDILEPDPPAAGARAADTPAPEPMTANGPTSSGATLSGAPKERVWPFGRETAANRAALKSGPANGGGLRGSLRDRMAMLDTGGRDETGAKADGPSPEGEASTALGPDPAAAVAFRLGPRSVREAPGAAMSSAEPSAPVMEPSRKPDLVVNDSPGAAPVDGMTPAAPLVPAKPVDVASSGTSAALDGASIGASKRDVPADGAGGLTRDGKAARPGDQSSPAVATLRALGEAPAAAAKPVSAPAAGAPAPAAGNAARGQPSAAQLVVPGQGSGPTQISALMPPGSESPRKPADPRTPSMDAGSKPADAQSRARAPAEGAGRGELETGRTGPAAPAASVRPTDAPVALTVAASAPKPVIPSSEAVDVATLNEAARKRETSAKQPELDHDGSLEAGAEATDGAAGKPAGSPSLEEVVREALGPVLQTWLDDNLPRLIEEQLRVEVQRAIAKSKPGATKS